MVVIGIAKGRGFSESLKLFTTVYSRFSLEFLSGRLPYQEVIPKKLAFIQVRGRDLPFMLDNKYIHAAICNSVWFSEYSFPDIKHIRSFGIKPCRLSLITPEDKANAPMAKICTRFPAIANKFFNSRNAKPEIITFSGGEETSLALGFADAIIDIIETGWTIKQMKLKELLTIQSLDHGLWINKGDTKTDLFIKKIVNDSKLLTSNLI